jgi:arylsulfatase A-like enzyme
LDILPTSLAAVGAKVDPSWNLDGVNLLPFLKGENKGKPHDMLYWRFGEQWAIRKGDLKLVASRIDRNEPRLYNLADDIGEAKDLTESRPEDAKALKAEWDKWNAEQSKPLWEPAQAGKKAKRKKKQ